MSKEPTNQEVINQVVGQLKAYFEPNFKSIDIRFQSIDERFSGVEKRLDKVEEGVSALYTLVDGAMTKANTVKEDHVSMIQWLKRNDVAIEKLKAKTKTR